MRSSLTVKPQQIYFEITKQDCYSIILSFEIGTIIAIKELEVSSLKESIAQ